MRLTIVFLAIALLAMQLPSTAATTYCHDIWVDAEDVFIQRDETEYLYFPIYNDSDESFRVYEATIWRESGEFEITLIDWPNTIGAEDEGELTIKVKTGHLDEESLGSAYIKVRGQFDDGKYCSSTSIDPTYFDVTVEIQEEEPRCRDIMIDAFNVHIGENSAKTVSFSIENNSDEDFDLYDISIDEDNSYFDAWLYSKPAEIGSLDSETFRVRVESNRVSSDKQGTVTVEAKGRFESGEYCSYSSIEDETFKVFVENEEGPGQQPWPGETCREIYLNAGSVRVETGSTAFATIFLENDSDETFLVDYVSVFDSSSNFKAEENGYEKRIPAFGSAYINVNVRAYDYAETGEEQAFVEVKGHFQNESSCYLFGGGIATFPVVIEEKQPEQAFEPAAQTCTYFSLIAPEIKTMQKSGTVQITIDNRTAERATLRLSGPGLSVQPKLISVPRHSLVSENVSVSSVLPETSLVYSIEALGCKTSEATKIIAAVTEPEQQAEEEEEIEQQLEALSSGFFVVGQAGAALGLIVLAGLAIYLILKPRMA